MSLTKNFLIEHKLVPLIWGMRKHIRVWVCIECSMDKVKELKIMGGIIKNCYNNYNFEINLVIIIISYVPHKRKSKRIIIVR